MGTRGAALLLRVRVDEFENMDCFRSGRDTEEGGGRVKGHTIDAGGHGTATELVKFLSRRDRENTDNGAFV